MLSGLRKVLLRVPVVERVDLSGRHYIVTGASVGSLGYATARALLSWGAQVTVTARSHSTGIVVALKSELPAAVHDNIYSRDVDIANVSSVRNFANWYAAERRLLDGLINNAGIHLDLLSQWDAPRLSDDGEEIQWRTNYLGSLHLSHLLKPLLLARAAEVGEARVINVVSMLHTRGLNSEFFNPTKPYNSWDAYGQSKLALVHMTMELQRRYGEQGLKAYCLHPGSVYTNVAAKGLSGNPFVEGLRNFLAPLERFFLLTPDEGARTSI
ncbi:MAG: SDR family NAD(P)-dependent oxidoreductase, partial [Spongiibacteraceae bacterium]